MPPLTPVLKVDVAHIDEACVIRARGELDLAGSPELELALEGAELTEAERLVLDLEDLEFIDSKGLHTLLDAAQRSARNGNRLEITRGTGQVARMMQLSEFENLLPLADACMCPSVPARRSQSRGHSGRGHSPSASRPRSRTRP